MTLLKLPFKVSFPRDKLSLSFATSVPSVLKEEQLVQFDSPSSLVEGSLTGWGLRGPWLLSDSLTMLTTLTHEVKGSVSHLELTRQCRL